MTYAFTRYNKLHPLNKYIIDKILVLEQLGIKLETEDITHMYNLNTEIAVDNFARKLILTDNDDNDDE